MLLLGILDSNHIQAKVYGYSKADCKKHGKEWRHGKCRSKVKQPLQPTESSILITNKCTYPKASLKLEIQSFDKDQKQINRKSWQTASGERHVDTTIGKDKTKRISNNPAYITIGYYNPKKGKTGKHYITDQQMIPVTVNKAYKIINNEELTKTDPTKGFSLTEIQSTSSNEETIKT